MPRKRWSKSPARLLPYYDEIEPNRNAIIDENATNIRHHRVLDIVSVIYGIAFLYFISFDHRYPHVGDLSFLFVPLTHIVVESIKLVSFKESNWYNVNHLYFLPMYTIAVFIFHIAFVLFGAELFDDIQATFVFSCTLASFVLAPLYFHCGIDAFLLLSLQENPKSKIQRGVLCVSFASIIGAWFGAFVIPLDWNRPWQMWPIPCVFGSLFGFIVGHIVSYFSSFNYFSYQHSKF